MTKEPKDNPGHITKTLCLAYRETLQSEIRGLRSTFITSISIATAIIGIIVVAMTYINP